MPTYIALIREDADGVFHVSFPDIPGLITAGDDLDEAIEEAEDALTFAAEDWTNPDGSTGLKPPRTIAQLRDDPHFVATGENADIVEIDLPAAE
jgi:predicted RNase H-like HicB family nuclease